MRDNIEYAPRGVAIPVGQTRIAHAAMMRVVIKQTICLNNYFGGRCPSEYAIATHYNFRPLSFIAHEDERNPERAVFLLKSATI